MVKAQYITYFITLSSICLPTHYHIDDLGSDTTPPATPRSRGDPDSAGSGTAATFTATPLAHLDLDTAVIGP